MAPPLVLAIGDSLTAGYGLAPHEAFPAQLQAVLRPTWPGIVVRNAGVSGETTTGALARLPRLLSSLPARPDLAIVELGGNDLLRGMQPAQTRRNLDAMLRQIGDCGIPVLLAAMEAPRFLGVFAEACDAIYVDLAATHDATVWPFFPPGVLGMPGLTLPDRLHPNARAIGLIAAHIAPAVDRCLRASPGG